MLAVTCPLSTLSGTSGKNGRTGSTLRNWAASSKSETAPIVSNAAIVPSPARSAALDCNSSASTVTTPPAMRARASMP